MGFCTLYTENRPPEKFEAQTPFFAYAQYLKPNLFLDGVLRQ